MKDPTETVGRLNSSETAQQNFLKLCSNEEHYMQMCISTGHFDSIFFWEQCPFFNFEIWRKWKILLKLLVSTTPLKPLNRIAWNFVVMKVKCVDKHFYRKCWFDPFKEQFISPFLSDCTSLKLGIAIHCIQHSQAMLERGVCELAHSFFHFKRKYDNKHWISYESW